MRLILLRRLRLKMPLGPRKCKCGRRLDRHGDHRVGCSNAGVLTKRSRPLEKALARVCREAGGRVAENAKLRDMNLRSIRANDARCIEVLASGLPLFFGQQLAVDATIVAPLHRNGQAKCGCDTRNGVSLARARRCKELQV